MNSTNDQLQEKKTVLEQELKRINVELANVLNLNDTLALENKEKDETISKKEQLLIELQEKDNQEIEQFLQERTCLEDFFSHEEDVIHDSIKKLIDLKNRYDNLEAENSLLSSSMEKIKNKMASETTMHAKSLHNINRNMRTMRQEMEATFRKELVEMDLHFQRQAFEAMDDEKKLAMLANLKLKDELALQSVGISNLGVRCGRDKQHFKDIKNKMKTIGQQVNSRRAKLSDLQMKKMRSGLNICTFESELNISEEKETRLKVELDLWPSYDELDEIEANLERVVESQHKMFKVWTARMKKSHVLESDYKRSNFARSDLAVSAKDSTLHESSYTMSCADTLAQVKDCDYNANLEEALQPIRGKESTLLPSEGTVSTCVAQVIHILRSNPRSESCDAPTMESSQVDPQFDLVDEEYVKNLVAKLQDTVRSHIADARISSGESMGDFNSSSQKSGRSALPIRLEFSGTVDDGKWLERPQSFENILATSNVKRIGNESKSKNKLTDVFVPEDVCMEPPVISNNLLEKVRLSSSAPNLRTKSVLNEVPLASTTRRKSKKSSKREDPLTVSKVKHSKRSMSTINLRPKDSKAEKIIQLMAQSYK